MFDIPIFLMRWLFLSNLVRDVAEIQTLPHQPYHPPPPPPQSVSPMQVEEAWRDNCLRGILSYPPGSQRLMVMDALRVELVQQLAQKLRQSEQTLQRHRLASLRRKHHHQRALGDSSQDSDDEEVQIDENDDDPFLDADVDIIRTFEQEAEGKDEDRKGRTPEEKRKAMLVISPDVGTNVLDSAISDKASEPELVTEEEPTPSLEQVQEAKKNLGQAREYLPQLVSAVLKSPPAFEASLVNPIQKLRQVMLNRCLEDPSWGIELCWLLEAEVGRAWKTLFEHRQQTGRRLIVVLPAEKAAVLAKIGTEKRETFDLLQDSEQATAYGYTMDHHHHHGQYALPQEDEEDGGHPTPRLPSSLSLRRCSHFGDTMHFIDRLTKISMDLRMMPAIQREAYLKKHLEEMNRRIRRRMATHGDVSLDVEDNRSPLDWPQTEDLTVDMLKHSVHFPLVPQMGIWPNGEQQSLPKHATSENTEVVRVLNIVVPESRILASRERCPYLVHLEVVDTGLEGSDARLYTSGASGLGSTVQEALGTAPSSSSQTKQRTHYGLPSYKVPSELVQEREHKSAESARQAMKSSEKGFPRGGWQSDQSFSYFGDEDAGFMNRGPYDAVRQQQYEQLHHQMHIQQQTESSVPAYASNQRRTETTGPALLDKVFGQRWDEKCRDIRDASPFGHVKGWRLASFIMKAGEDIRREALVMQIISKLQRWFEDEIPEAHRPFMRPYTIMCVGGDAGLIECLSDAKSVDEVKKRTDGFESLRDYFERAYGPPSPRRHARGYAPPPRSSPGDQITFDVAQDNFLRSLVGYSLLCYILQIKDRHNGNILLDRKGHIVHIDFGFVLGDTPKMGKVPIFSERAPFKLNGEFWEVLGGWNISEGGLGVRFCKMFELAFACASAHADEIATLVEATMLALDSNPRAARMIATGVRSRLRMRGAHQSVEQKSFVMDIVNAALTSWGTSTYDWLQRSMHGYQ